MINILNVCKLDSCLKPTSVRLRTYSLPLEIAAENVIAYENVIAVNGHLPTFLPTTEVFLPCTETPGGGHCCANVYYRKNKIYGAPIILQACTKFQEGGPSC